MRDSSIQIEKCGASGGAPASFWQSGPLHFGSGNMQSPLPGAGGSSNSVHQVWPLGFRKSATPTTKSAAGSRSNFTSVRVSG
jgi:hypothetical protein